MINVNTNLTSLTPNGPAGLNNSIKIGGANNKNEKFSNTIKAVAKYMSETDDLQQSSDTAIKDLITGKTGDINSVVSTMAKADMSFKLLVGVRNKLIEAYKQTMNMPL